MTVSIQQKSCQEGGKLLDGQSRREKMNGLGYQLLCGVCAFAFAQPALAQDSGPDQAAAERSASGSVSTSDIVVTALRRSERSEEHTSELQSLMRISYAVFCLKKKTEQKDNSTE